ncbi:MAG: SpoIIE family protein phosphatase [Acidimicrobiia bacterium]|nr:SpoIIE family protein phosphatase [Acidimicrobiia bacterium]
MASSPQLVTTEESSFAEEFRLFWPDGTMRWLCRRGRVLSDKHDRPVILSGVLLDITDRKEAEEERAGLLAAEKEARGQAEEALAQAEEARADADARRHRLAQLESVTEAGLAHLSLYELLAELLERVQAVLAVDVVVVSLLDASGPLVVRAAVGIDGLAAGVSEGGDQQLARQLGTRVEPVLIEDVDGPDCPIPYLRGQGLRSLVVVPLVVEGHMTGALQVATRRSRRFSRSDVRLLQLVADRMALAIDRVQTFEREHSIAEQLQRSLLPDGLPDLHEADLAGVYRPGAAATVGGDWYDVILLPDGQVALVMGDVVGSGVRAASTMGQLRAACRILIGQGHQPAEIVRSLNRFAIVLGEGEMATFAYLVLDPSSGRGQLVIAGHLPPLVRQADGACGYLNAEASLPLGVRANARYHEHAVELGPGSTVLLYTDGLIERRDSSLDDGFDRLSEAMAAAPSDPSEGCDFVLRSLLGDDEPGDDVALLALRRSDAAPGPFTLRLPAEPTALSRLRRALRNWLGQTGANEEETSDLTLATSEAAANAAEHAYGPIDAHYQVSATVAEGVVEIVVRDFGRWRPPRGANRGRGLLLMKALANVTIHRTNDGTEVRLGRRLANPRHPTQEKTRV